MTRFACVMGIVFVLTSSAAAQTTQTTITGTEDGVEVMPPTSSEQARDEKRSVYDKRVGGLVWLEATAGPSKFNVTQFRTLEIIPDQIAALIPRFVVSGPEFGAALRFRAKSVTIGARFKKADYEPFDLITAGLDLGFLVRAVPYVTPSFRLGLNYNTTTGGLALPGYGDLVQNVQTHGGGASLGMGLRIPIIKWISIAADFDYSIIGLAVRGTETITGGSFRAGTAGSAIAGMFALTIHLGT